MFLKTIIAVGQKGEPMSILIKDMEMPSGCIYANDKDETEYCPMLNHDDVPYCKYIENEPEAAIGIDERPCYCPLAEAPEPCEDAVSRKSVSEWLDKWEGYIDADIIARMQYRIIDIPPAQPEPEHTMEEFMYGQELGDPEDGSL